MMEMSMETETTKWSEFTKGGKAIAEPILVSEEINLKEQECENHSLGSERKPSGKLTIWVRSFEIEKL